MITTTAAAAGAEVSILLNAFETTRPENAFDPSDLTVVVGTTVRWTNADSQVHTVTSGSSDGVVATPDGGVWFGNSSTRATHSHTHSPMRALTVLLHTTSMDAGNGGRHGLKESPGLRSPVLFPGRQSGSRVAEKAKRETAKDFQCVIGAPDLSWWVSRACAVPTRTSHTKPP